MLRKASTCKNKFCAVKGEKGTVFQVTPQQILKTLDAEQEEAVLLTNGPLCIIAGAGTGKTKTITHRIAYAVLTGAVAPEQILAVTHSQKAAGEMRSRLRQLGVGDVTARTFHSAALKQLKHFWPRTGKENSINILSSRYSLVRRSLEKDARAALSHPSAPSLEKPFKDKSKSEVTTELVLDVSSEIGWAKSQLILPADYAVRASKSGRKTSHPLEKIAEAYKDYEETKDYMGQIDFEDMLLLTAQLIEEDPWVASEVHGAYSYFVVDEYQDTDPLQEKLLDAWLGKRKDICVVGDVEQSIFSFKGASPLLLENFSKKWKDTKTVHLVKDYRSTPEVVDLANRVVSPLAKKLIGMQPSGPVPEVKPLASEPEEEKWVASRVKDLLTSGVPASEIAVLYRFNSQSARFEQALASQNISYIVSDTEKFFDRPEVRSVLINFGKAAREEPEEVGAYLLRLSLAEANWDRDNPPNGAGAARDRWEALSALLSIVESMPDCETLSAEYLLKELQHRAMEQHAPSQATITLSTLHKAKGLEWDSVFLVRVTEGSLPSTYASTQEQIAEEKRLLYVGITRAKKNLFISHAKTRENGWNIKPSRFLVDLDFAQKPKSKKKSFKTEEDPFWDAPLPKGAVTPFSKSEASSAIKSDLFKSSAVINSKEETLLIGSTCSSCAETIGSSKASKLGVCKNCLQGEDLRKYNSLKNWRTKTVEKDARLGKSIKASLSDDVLLAIVAAKPQNATALFRLGIDPAVRARWSEEILAALK